MITTNEILNKILEVGPIVIIPGLLLLIGFITTREHFITFKVHGFNIKLPFRNIWNCLLIFAGMMGMAITLTLFLNFFNPLIQTIISNSPKDFAVTDIGWAASKQIIFHSPFTAYILIAIGGLNLIMLLARLTRTINLDLWNWWIFLVVGSLIFAITQVQWLGVLIVLIISAITLVIGDVYAPYIEQYYGLKGVSNPQTQIVAWAPISHIINGILNHIPGIRRVHLFFGEIQYKLGIFSEPMIMGFIFGFICGLLTRYRNFTLNIWPNIIFALGMGLQLAIIMVLMPRFVNLMYRGLYPAINDIVSFINRKITKRELYIGLDAIFFVGHPEVIGLSIIMVPLSVYIATILPGNNILPNADLILIPFLIVWAIAPSRGDIFRSFISSAVIIPLTLWVSSDLASLFTNFFTKYNLEISGGIKNITSYAAGSNWLFWILLQIVKPILNIFS